MNVTPDPLATAVFLVLAMGIAGCAHVVWLKSAIATKLRQPIDAGLTLRGRRLFGRNKMTRGFVAMPLAGAAVFGVMGALHDSVPRWLADGMWMLTPVQYGALGFACGLAFMFAELPNSFIKRQLDVVPGRPPSSVALRCIFFVVDRCDSVLGVLIMVSLLVPVHALTWFWTILFGPCLHAAFSGILYRLGVKERAL